jgi:hypothetical protein
MIVYVLFVHKKSVSQRKVCIIFIKRLKTKKKTQKNIFSAFFRWFFWFFVGWVFYCQPCFLPMCTWSKVKFWLFARAPKPSRTGHLLTGPEAEQPAPVLHPRPPGGGQGPQHFRPPRQVVLPNLHLPQLFQVPVPAPRNLSTLNQGCGFAFISSGSGSSILGWTPIWIRIQSGSRALTLSPTALGPIGPNIERLFYQFKLALGLTISLGIYFTILHDLRVLWG